MNTGEEQILETAFGLKYGTSPTIFL